MKINNLSSVFGGKVPGVNAPLKFSDAVSEGNGFMKNISGQSEKGAWERMMTQKKMSLFGDADKDKTLNIFDCAPLDRMKQATVHKLLPPEKPPGTWDKFKTGVSKVVAPVGQFVSEKGQEWKTAKQAETTHRRDVEMARAKAGVSERPQQAPKQAYDNFTRPVGKRMRQVEGGISQFGNDLQSGIAAAPMAGSQKIKSLIGGAGSGYGMRQTLSGRPSGAGIYEALGKEAPAPTMDLQPQGQPQGQPQFQPQEMKYSQHSKRPVSYTRGPYRKRQIYVPSQYGPQQPQQQQY